jgi:hypothetical protein
MIDRWAPTGVDRIASGWRSQPHQGRQPLRPSSVSPASRTVPLYGLWLRGEGLDPMRGLPDEAALLKARTTLFQRSIWPQVDAQGNTKGSRFGDGCASAVGLGAAIRANSGAQDDTDHNERQRRTAEAQSRVQMEAGSSPASAPAGPDSIAPPHGSRRWTLC